MSRNFKRGAAYIALVLIIGSIGFYATMEDYQKENVSKLISQTF